MGNIFIKVEQLKRTMEVITTVEHDVVTFHVVLPSGESKQIGEILKQEYDNYYAAKFGYSVASNVTGNTAYHGYYNGVRRGCTIMNGERIPLDGSKQ